VVLRLLANGWIRQEAHMANDRNPIRKRNPMRDEEEDLNRSNEEDLVSQADDDDLDDIDEMEEDDDEDLEA
jgi:hypothetical protein